MRLLTKSSLIIITISIFIFLGWNLVFFNVAKQMIYKHVNNELINSMHKVIKVIKAEGVDMVARSFIDEVTIEPVGRNFIRNASVTDTVIFNSIQKRYVPYRVLWFTMPVDQQNYKISIFKSLISTDNLIERFTITSIIMVMVFVLVIFFMNHIVFRSVWSNFFSNLVKVEKYDIKSNEPLQLEASEITEFIKLNGVLQKMAHRIQTDYVNLKELTANTSHELQTPLAIIKNRAEILLQSPNLNEDEMETVASIMNTAQRLSKLNQSLLLIAKIENEQFGVKSLIRVDEVLSKIIDQFQMIAEVNGCKIIKQTTDVQVVANPMLMDILFSNLIKNALIHGNSNSEISIILTQSKFAIKNTGAPLKMKVDRLFQRFAKDSGKKDSSGLGLAIVKKICDYCNMEIAYSYNNDSHNFEIDFQKIIEEKL